MSLVSHSCIFLVNKITPVSVALDVFIHFLVKVLPDFALSMTGVAFIFNAWARVILLVVFENWVVKLSEL